VILGGRLERVKAADLAGMRGLTVFGGFVIGWPWNLIGKEANVSD
jgi:hypothetical protein